MIIYLSAEISLPVHKKNMTADLAAPRAMRRYLPHPEREAGGAVTQPAADMSTGQDTMPAATSAPEHARSQSNAAHIQHRDGTAGSADEDPASADGVSGYSESDGMAYVEVELPEDDITVVAENTGSTDGPAAMTLQEDTEDTGSSVTATPAAKTVTATDRETAAGDTDVPDHTAPVTPLHNRHRSDAPSPFRNGSGSQLWTCLAYGRCSAVRLDPYQKQDRRSGK